MAAIPAKKLTSWSYSRWSCYIECPAKAKYKFIDKREEPGSPAMDRGNTIHKNAEAFVKGEVKKLLPELASFTQDLKGLRKSKASAELSITLTKDWVPCEWNDWDRAWLRIKIDALQIEKDHATVIDYKTGKIRTGYEMQLSLYDMGTLIAYPTLKTVESELWYVDHGVVKPDAPHLVTRKEIEPLKKMWLGNVKAMLSDTKFAPRAGDYCRYCHFRKSNGGPCEY